MFIPRDELFLLTVEDLRKRLEDPSDYDLVRAAGICRQLLLDKRPFLFMIERMYEYKTTFRVVGFNDDIFYARGLTLVWASILPTCMFKGTVKELAIREFLGTTILRVDDYKYDVTDIINAASHCMGGIHSFDPIDDREAALNNLEKGGVIGDGHKTNHYAIKAICQVVLNTLTPLEKIVKERRIPTSVL